MYEYGPTIFCHPKKINSIANSFSHHPFFGVLPILEGDNSPVVPSDFNYNGLDIYKVPELLESFFLMSQMTNLLVLFDKYTVEHWY